MGHGVRVSHGYPGYRPQSKGGKEGGWKTVPQKKQDSEGGRTLSAQLARLSLHRAFPLIPFILIDAPFIAGCTSNLPLEHAGWRREMQPAASLVPVQGGDQQLPGRASSGLLYLSVWSPGPLSHRSLIFTSMSFCQNAGSAVSCLTCFLPFLQWLRVNPPGAIPSNVSPHWLLTPKRYHSSCPQGLVPSYLCSLTPGSP